MPASGMSSSQARPAGLSSAACSEPLGGGAEPSRVGGGLLQERAHPPPRPRSQSLTRSESFSSSHRRASLSPSPSARAAPNLCASWGRSSNDAYDDTCVLFVADRPAVALTLARAFSGGKQVRTRGHGLLKTHDCFGYFAPAGRRCSFAITSVAGHLLVSDLVPPPPHEVRSGLRSVFTARTRKVTESLSARLSVHEHLKREAAGRAWLCFWTSTDAEGDAIAFEVFRALPQVRRCSPCPPHLVRALPLRWRRLWLWLWL